MAEPMAETAFLAGIIQRKGEYPPVPMRNRKNFEMKSPDRFFSVGGLYCTIQQGDHSAEIR